MLERDEVVLLLLSRGVVRMEAQIEHGLFCWAWAAAGDALDLCWGMISCCPWAWLIQLDVVGVPSVTVATQADPQDSVLWHSPS